MNQYEISNSSFVEKKYPGKITITTAINYKNIIVSVNEILQDPCLFIFGKVIDQLPQILFALTLEIHFLHCIFNLVFFE